MGQQNPFQVIEYLNVWEKILLFGKFLIWGTGEALALNHKILTYAVRFVANSKNLPKHNPKAPHIGLDVEVSSLEVFRGHPGPRNQLPLGFLVI